MSGNGMSFYVETTLPVLIYGLGIGAGLNERGVRYVTSIRRYRFKSIMKGMIGRDLIHPMTSIRRYRLTSIIEGVGLIERKLNYPMTSIRHYRFKSIMKGVGMIEIDLSRKYQSRDVKTMF